ncbi:hypothetical protein LSH36_1385g00014 [Paralvinella palmiformis]|uniref:Uncharacterized protein n=1 Tax=Paralvinella palmiformis TaxID=53620 RepID=A0AAD9MQG1_9ANNE|nr:hypothetical protein LSH36_1385g00014 [Paralvinella palmiformis]
MHSSIVFSSLSHYNDFFVAALRIMASKVVVKVPYVNTLDALAKQRYLDKIRRVDNVDPYSLLNSAWTQKGSCFPAVSYPDIVNYLIFNKSCYTMEDMKAWKSLEAYNQLTSGWISDVAFVLSLILLNE